MKIASHVRKASGVATEQHCIFTSPTLRASPHFASAAHRQDSMYALAAVGVHKPERFI